MIKMGLGGVFTCNDINLRRHRQISEKTVSQKSIADNEESVSNSKSIENNNLSKTNPETQHRFKPITHAKSKHFSSVTPSVNTDDQKGQDKITESHYCHNKDTIHYSIPKDEAKIVLKMKKMAAERPVNTSLRYGELSQKQSLAKGYHSGSRIPWKYMETGISPWASTNSASGTLIRILCVPFLTSPRRITRVSMTSPGHQLLNDCHTSSG